MSDHLESLTSILGEWGEGRNDALHRLIPRIHADLRHLAASRLRGERVDHTLQPTALVHEVYLRLLDQERAQWHNRGQFFAICGRLMRRILVDYARERQALKRGGDHQRVTLLTQLAEETGGFEVEVLELEEALVELSALDERQARIVEHRFFGGLSVVETAQLLAISTATVKRDWALARAWLFRRLQSA
jgi:RNA polymerase sigma factor (TIGR02999 family)